MTIPTVICAVSIDTFGSGDGVLVLRAEVGAEEPVSCIDTHVDDGYPRDHRLTILAILAIILAFAVITAIIAMHGLFFMNKDP